MTTVTFKTLPTFYHRFSQKYWPGPPPIFQDCGPEGPSEEDKALARELFAALDEMSKKWYRRPGIE